MADKQATVTLAAIERLAEAYGAANERLALLNSLLSADINTLIRQRMPEIRDQIELTCQARAALKATVEAAPQLFAKPRTRVLAGVKVGYQRLKTALAIADEAKVIAKIKALMPERAGELIRTQEALRRQALDALPAADLKRIGVGVVVGSDVVITKPVTADAIKSAEAVLATWTSDEVAVFEAAGDEAARGTEGAGHAGA